ncbi:hypothetical protein [Sphingomonas solaris]|uniref:Uncharacterized protein n=1 Tax=Alterirhizorhabdus solaris TaxID=2529389 RepID=A0A558R3X5_9SPHN|nr:hypothetical protein [Sphingomonas solaris]TVV74094.1 hypothetical protein FOY91_10715 [Sphingomonas solaris]
MEVRVLFWAPLSVKAGHHWCGRIAVSHNCGFQRALAALDMDDIVVYGDAIDQQPDISFAQGRVVALQMLADRLAKPGNGVCVDSA